MKCTFTFIFFVCASNSPFLINHVLIHNCLFGLYGTQPLIVQKKPKKSFPTSPPSSGLHLYSFGFLLLILTEDIFSTDF